jgi:hypothetical protein
MGKTLAGLVVCFFVLTASVFGQAVDRNQYKAIDPFDYKLDEENAASGVERKYKSVVRFVSQNSSVFQFISLDRGTTLSLANRGNMRPPSAGQTVTIYYTATRRIRDILVLDEIDSSNTTEAGIGLVKSTVPASAIDRSDYKDTSVWDYILEAEQTEQGDVRKYRSTVLFSGRDGLNYSFSGGEGDDMITLKVTRRFNPITENHIVIIYYTAEKGFPRDMLVLDDITY